MNVETTMEQRVAEKKEEMPAMQWEDESALTVDTQEEDVTGAGSHELEDDRTDAEEQQLRQQARWLLKNFKNLLDRKHKQEEEMLHVPLFTRDDALYKLSGMAAHQEGDRVQTSNIANAPDSAAMNVDEMLERMNKEVQDEVSKGYDQLCEKVSLINVALSLVSYEASIAGKQMYYYGVKRDRVVAPDGHYYCKDKVYEFRHEIEDMLVFLMKKIR